MADPSNIIPGVPSDAKGAYYSPREQGWATILDDRYPSFWAGLGRGIGAMAKAKRAKQKALDDKLLKMKPEDHGRQFQNALDKTYQNILDDYASGNLGDVQFQKRVGEYITLAQRSRVIQDDAEEMMKMAKDKNLPIKNQRFIAYNNAKLGGNGTIEDLKEISKQEFNPLEFLDEDGGSSIIDANHAVDLVVDQSFGRQIKIREWSKGGWENAPYETKSIEMMTATSSLPIFAKVVDPQNKVIAVKDEDELINDRIYDAFEQDPYTNRVMIDGAKRKLAVERGVDIGDIRDSEINDGMKATVLKGFLQSKVEGEVSETGNIWTIQRRGGGLGMQQKKVEGLDLWTNHFRGGNLNQFNQAMEYISGVDTDMGSIAYKVFTDVEFGTNVNQFAQRIYKKDFDDLNNWQQQGIRDFMAGLAYTPTRDTDAATGGEEFPMGEETPEGVRYKTPRMAVVTLRQKDSETGNLETKLFVLDPNHTSKNITAQFYNEARKIKGFDYTETYEQLPGEPRRIEGDWFDINTGQIRSPDYEGPGEQPRLDQDGQ